MDPRTKAAIDEIDSVLAEAQQLPAASAADKSQLAGRGHAAKVLLCEAAVHRLAPAGSTYRAAAERWRQQFVDAPMVSNGTRARASEGLTGILIALRQDYVAGRLSTISELIRTDIFSDFLDIAEYLLAGEKLKDPAAVIVGGVLEEHLRKLCGKYGIDTEYVDASGNTQPKKLDTMNADLAKAGAIGKNDQKQITAWAGVRNDAAHGHFGKYQREQVDLMVQGIRGFIARFPA